MVEVPFIKLGPGQSARLAWQVMGRNGPIFVPRNIRYIPPGTEGLPNASMGGNSGPLAALSGVNLALNVGTLAISAEILRIIYEVNHKLDTALTHLHSIKDKIDDIAHRTQRIDIKVAESHLREALDYVTRNAVKNDTIDLEKLATLAEDIESLVDVVDGRFVYSNSIRLSSDVKSRLSALHCFLFNLRRFVVEQHNLSCNSTLNHVVSFDVNLDYLSIDRHIDFAKATVRFNAKISNLADSIAKDVLSRFTFAYVNDADYYAHAIIDGIVDPFIEIFGEDFDNGISLFTSLPDEVSDSKDYEKIDNIITTMANSWLWGSDSGLLFMTHRELVGVRDGYQEWFYPQLAKSSELFSGIKQLTSDFDTSQLMLKAAT